MKRIPRPPFAIEISTTSSSFFLPLPLRLVVLRWCFECHQDRQNTHSMFACYQNTVIYLKMYLVQFYILHCNAIVTHINQAAAAAATVIATASAAAASSSSLR